MPSERTKPSSRTSTTTSQGSRGQRKPSEASKNEPVKEPHKPKDKTSTGRPEVDKGKDKRPDPRGWSMSDRQKVDEKKTRCQFHQRSMSTVAFEPVDLCEYN